MQDILKQNLGQSLQQEASLADPTQAKQQHNINQLL